MERLIASGRLDAVLDLTTTEICDYLMGGNMSAGPSRLEAAAKAGIPNIISLGATDMVNFGPKATVPEKYAERLLFEHIQLLRLCVHHLLSALPLVNSLSTNFLPSPLRKRMCKFGCLRAESA